MNKQFYEDVKKNKPLIITHQDADGILANILFRYYLTKYDIDYNICFTDYNTVDYLEQELIDHNLIVYADLAPTKESYDNLIKMGKTIYILDHHETSREKLGDLPNYYYDITKSATKIVYEFLTEGLPERAIHQGIKKTVDYVNAYDLFLTDTPEFKYGKYMHYNLYKHVFANGKGHRGNGDEGYYDFINLQLRKFHSFNDFKWVPIERKYIQESVKQENEVMREAKKTYQKRVDSMGRSYGYIEIGTKVSLIASMILTQIKDIEYMVVHNTFKPKENKFSLRGKDNFDVRTIAEKYGGGGHRQAAGLNIENDDLKEKYRKGVLHFG